MIEHRLEVHWSKAEGDLVADLSPRFDNSALRVVLCEIFTPAVQKDLENRGFDIKTLRFRIDRTKERAAIVEASQKK